MSFQQALSGLNASSNNLDVIGNNIANANTYGAKQSRAEFADMYAASIGYGSADQVGIGVRTAAITQQFTQGNITATDSALDVAINGDGFFQLMDSQGNTNYSRNGQFQLDRNGYIINNGGLQLMGYPADNQGTIQPGQTLPLQLPTGGIAPNPTSAMSLEFNLDARLATTDPGAGTSPRINYSDATTYNNATSMTVYDDKGQPIELTYYFQKSATDEWNVYVRANGSSIGGSDADPEPVTTMTFPANGSAPTAPASDFTIDIPAGTNDAGAETLALSGVGLDLTNTTQYGASFGVTDITQDGYTAGSLNSIVIEDDGTITARYSNGQSKAAGQVELATFRNPQGLQAIGGNLWQLTHESGEPIKGNPSSGGLGALQSGALEESNVDLTSELVNMITAQRNYQANAQTIKTQDQVMQTLVNLR